jgi:hypothetical protein
MTMKREVVDKPGLSVRFERAFAASRKQIIYCKEYRWLCLI